jgi:hypothetical protein
MVFIVSLMISILQSAELPRLVAKQQLTKIRYITQDGKVTYYQESDGELYVSKNFKTNKLLDFGPGAHFVIKEAHESNKLVITAKKDFHLTNNVAATRDIFTTTKGSNQAKKVGRGLAPKFHLKGTWLSFYDTENSTLEFRSFIVPYEQFSIKLKNLYSPYFIPDVVMLNNLKILYTDRNKENIEALLLFERNKKKISPLIKTPRSGIKIEVCRNQEKVFIATYGLDRVKKGSTIDMWSTQSEFKIGELKNLYQSEMNDLGSLICSLNQDKVYFIKTTNKGLSAETDLFSLDIKSKKTSPITNLKYVTQAYIMDGALLVPYRDQIYVVNGNYDFSKEGLE